MGFHLFLLEPIRHLRGPRAPCSGAIAPTTSPFEPFCGRQIEDQGKIGPDALNGDPLQRVDELGRQIAGDALIDPRRIHEAIAQNDRALLQSRKNDGTNVIIARGGKQNGFHPYTKGFCGSRQKHMPKGFRARRTARFPRGDHMVALLIQPIGKPADLGRLSSPLAAFETNEEP